MLKWLLKCISVFLINMLANDNESLCPGSCVHIDMKFACLFDISGREVSAMRRQKKKKKVLIHCSKGAGCSETFRIITAFAVSFAVKRWFT